MRRTITFISNRKKTVLGISTILYILMNGKKAQIHVYGGRIYETRMTLSSLEEELGDGFIRVNKGCLVATMAVCDVADRIHLINGEELIYTLGKKNQIIDQVHAWQRDMFRSFGRMDIPGTQEEYREHFQIFEKLPIAFTDIEMVLDEESHAVDWIFKYGNAALAKLEKKPLDQLIGSSFGRLFPNMDTKWLKYYTRVALYNETMEFMEYSPEIDAHLQVICFPTFKGHCGCILFPISNATYTKDSMEAEHAMMMYFKEKEKKKEKNE